MKKSFTLLGKKYYTEDLVSSDWKLEITPDSNATEEIKISSAKLGLTLRPKVRVSIFVLHHFIGSDSDRLSVNNDGYVSLNGETNLSFTGTNFINAIEIEKGKEEDEFKKYYCLGRQDLVEGQHYKTMKGRIFKYIGLRLITLKKLGTDGEFYSTISTKKAHYLREIIKPHKKYADKYIKFSKSLEFIELVPMKELKDIENTMVQTYHRVSELGNTEKRLNILEIQNTLKNRIIGYFQIILYKKKYYVNLRPGNLSHIDGEWYSEYKEIKSIEKVLLDIVSLGEKFNIMDYTSSKSIRLGLEDKDAIGIEIH